jgi:hypothetical protein
MISSGFFVGLLIGFFLGVIVMVILFACINDEGHREYQARVDADEAVGFCVLDPEAEMAIIVRDPEDVRWVSTPAEEECKDIQ